MCKSLRAAGYRGTPTDILTDILSTPGTVALHAHPLFDIATGPLDVEPQARKGDTNSRKNISNFLDALKFLGMSKVLLFSVDDLAEVIINSELMSMHLRIWFLHLCPCDIVSLAHNRCSRLQRTNDWKVLTWYGWIVATQYILLFSPTLFLGPCICDSANHSHPVWWRCRACKLPFVPCGCVKHIVFVIYEFVFVDRRAFMQRLQIKYMQSL